MIKILACFVLTFRLFVLSALNHALYEFGQRMNKYYCQDREIEKRASDAIIRSDTRAKARRDHNPNPLTLILILNLVNKL